MYFLIESKDQLDKLELPRECFVRVIQNNDYYHPILSKPCLIYYNDFSKGYIIAIDHTECQSIAISDVIEFLNKVEIVFVEDLKYHLYHLPINNMVDVMFHYINLNGNHELNVETLQICRDFHRRLNIPDVNRLIPVTKHLENMENRFNVLKYYCVATENDDFNRLYSSVYKDVEMSGIKVTQDFFIHNPVKNLEYMYKNSIIYSSYNLYNITSRPTNTFNGVNFLAFPKNELRNSIVPKLDRLVEYDFDSYHLRLISNLIGYVPVSGNIDHADMARYYFGIEGDVSDEYYAKSKAITFKQLYGKIENKYKSIPFYKLLSDYIDQLWTNFTSEGFLKLPTGRVIHYSEDFNKTRLFNYVIQNLETLSNVHKIKMIHDRLKVFKSKLILIVYDSFLFDFSADDGKLFLREIESVLKLENYGIRRKVGKTYSFD